MDKTLADILGKDILPKDVVAELQEAFNNKIAEAKEELTMQIRNEFAARYEHDTATLVEVTEKILNDVCDKTEKTKTEEVEKLKESKTKLDKAIKEARVHYKNKLTEAITALQNKKKKLEETYAKKTAEVLSENKNHIKKIDEFVVRQVSKELKDLAIDRRQLVEARVKLIKEAKEKISGTQKKFIIESAKKVEKIVENSLKAEVTQFRDDIETARKNSFGRKIFEAVAAEFMTSNYLTPEIKKLKKLVESKTKELEAAKIKLNENARNIDIASRKVKLAEERAVRTKIMIELLSNLKGEKRSVMESMLETTKTNQLKEAFDRFLPVVLSEGSNKKRPEVLNENRTRRIVTGDKNFGISNNVDNDFNSEINTILKNAGVKQ